MDLHDASSTRADFVSGSFRECGVIIVTVTKVLEPFWGAEEALADGFTEKDILELIQEDVPAFLEGATWSVKIEVDEGKSA